MNVTGTKRAKTKKQKKKFIARYSRPFLHSQLLL